MLITLSLLTMLFVHAPTDVPLNKSIHEYQNAAECSSLKTGEQFCVGQFLYEEVR